MSKIALPIAELKPALAGLGKIIAKRTTLPDLNHIKIERTKEGWTGITATDLDYFVTVRMEQPSTGDPVTLLIPFEELAKIAKTCAKNDTLLLRPSEGNSVTVEYAIGNEVAKAKIDSLPAEEFPETPRIKGDSVPVPDALREAIHQAMECASIDETRLILNGAFLDVSKPNAHYVVGTDGRHLFSSNSFNLPLKDSLIIPSHKFLEWKEFGADGEWQIKAGIAVKSDPPQFQISSRRWRFIGRQIDGNYPNWRQVIPDPSAFKTTLEFDPKALERIAQIIPRMPCDDAVNFAIGLEFSGKRLRLLGRSPNAETWTKVEIQDVKGAGKDATIFLNRHFLVKALQFGLTKAEIIDGMSPMVFSSGGRQMVVMPTRPEMPASPAQSASASTPAAPEPGGTQETESVSPGNDQPAASAAQPERKNMPRTSSTPPNAANGNGTQTPTAENKPALEVALDQIETIKGSHREAIRGLNELGDTLKQVQREHKTIQSFRNTLERLQTVKL